MGAKRIKLEGDFPNNNINCVLEPPFWGFGVKILNRKS